MDKFPRYASISIILLIALALRLPNLERVPYWYWDEGVNMNIAWNLVNGMALWFSLKFPFMPHPPLFFMVGGILLQMFGNELIVMRALSVFYGILTTATIYLIAREFFSERISLLSAFLFAIYPVAIYWNRMAFANNQLTLLILLAMYSFWKYVHECRFTNKKADRWLYIGSLFTGLALITELFGFFLLVSIFIIIREGRVKPIVLSLILPAIFFATMFAFMPAEFIHDTAFTLKRFGITFNSLLILSLTSILIYILREKVIGILIRLRNFYTNLAYDSVLLPGESKLPQDERRETAKKRLRSNAILFLVLLNLLAGITLIFPFSDVILFKGVDYFWLGIFGLLMAKNDARKFLIAFFLPLFLVTFILTGRTDHLVIPLLPFFCLGLVVFLREIYSYMGSFSIQSIVILILLSYPLAFVLYHDASSFILGNGLIHEDIDGRIEAAGFINSRTSPEDVVITDSHLGRFINSRTSVLIQSIAFQGRQITYMAPDYGRERFEFDPSHGNARFIVITPEVAEWLSENDEEMFMDIQKWPTHSVGGYIIYENPRE